MDSFSESKPSVNNLKRIINEQDFLPQDVIMIGNSPIKDTSPALKLGIKGILFDPERLFPKEKSINNLKEILAI